MVSAIKKKTVKLSFAQWLRLKRDILNLTQAQLAKKIGVKPSTISSWEKKVNDPGLDPEQTRQMCIALDVSLADLAKAFRGEVETYL